MNAIRMPRTVRYSIWLALCVLLLATARSSAADTQAYVIEMIVFERPGGGAEEFWPDAPGEPDRALANRVLGAGTAIPAEARQLGPIAYTLSRRGLVVLRHLAWQEVPASRNSQAWQWLDAGRLSGLVKITRGRFLHLDTDLLLRDATSPATYRIQLSRRMRSNELHYVDHPKVGIVIQATRVERPADPDGPDPAAGEPLPAAPPAAEPPAG
jgi:hypothetical protein